MSGARPPRSPSDAADNAAAPPSDAHGGTNAAEIPPRQSSLSGGNIVGRQASQHEQRNFEYTPEEQVMLEVPRQYSALRQDVDRDIEARKRSQSATNAAEGARPVAGTAETEADTEGGEARRQQGPTAAGEKEGEAMADLSDFDAHKVPLEELLKSMGADLDNGLATEDARRRLEENGANELSPPKSLPWFLKLAKQFTNFFSLLLIAGGVLCFIAYALDPTSQEGKSNLYLGIVLLAVVTITALFTYAQEAKAARTMEGFKNLLPPKCKAIRDGGEVQEVESRELVVGDLVEVQAGDKVPADIRIVENWALKVDNSSMTGESEPQSRDTECTDDNPLETKNLGFKGSLCVQGRARGVVVLTGDRTVIGRIAHLASSTDNEETPIGREIGRFVVVISVIAIIVGLIFFVVAIANDPSDWVSAVVFLIGIIVAQVPEGLLATVVVSLTLAAKRMAAKNVLVKNLEAVETLGSTSVIASDKTGTLTQNRMTVVHTFHDMQTHVAEETVARGAEEDPSFAALLRIGLLCSRATFDPSTLDEPVLQRKVNGDASEAAILKFVEPARSSEEAREASPKLAEIAFNSQNKFQVSVHRREDDRKSCLLVMKGAPERVLQRCDRVLLNGVAEPLTDERRSQIEAGNLELGGMGERVLGFAHAELDSDEYPPDYAFDTEDVNFPLDGLVFVGLMALLDPPREAVPHAVHLCQSAGVRVIMVTGDHPVTAEAIARQVGIIRGKTPEEVAAERGASGEVVDVKSISVEEAPAIVVNGGEMRDLSEDDWSRILAHPQVVFARTSPAQKLEIVTHLQEISGEVVAVTGDGVNDSPALKKADIGVAMGITGSDVSKEAADMILLDDNFASIVNGVEEGRKIFDNLKKSIAYTLSSKIPELSPFLVFIIIKIPLALTTILILCIDLGTDMVPAISLAYERGEDDLMRRAPRNAKTDHLVNRLLLSFSFLQIGVMQAAAGFFSYIVVFNDYGVRASTLLQTADRWACNNCGVDGAPALLYQRSADSLFFVQSAADEQRALDNAVSQGAVPPGTSYDAAEGALLNVGTFPRFIDKGTQEELLHKAQTAFFVSIVVVQWADLVICKTRRLSLYHQGMLSNRLLLFGLFFETALALLLTYVPFLNTIFGTAPLYVPHLFTAFPWAVLILAYDEIRKLLIRLRPRRWVDKYTYW